MIVHKLDKPFAYLVCYQLSNNVAHYDLLAKELSSSLKWMHYLPNVWFIVRHEPINELGLLLQSKVYPTDKILIMPAVGPITGLMPKEAWDWINEAVPRLW
jgi:hypothetical protein